MSEMKLFCIPYAGGSALVYAKWRKYLHSSIELCPLEMAGRGKRDDVPFIHTFHDAVNDLYHSIKEKLDCTYAIFGHSMGSWLAYELYHKIISEGHREPMHMFFSGNAAPHIERDEKLCQDLSDEEFREEILKIGGTRKEIFDNEQLLHLYLPILRADCRVLESYKYVEKNQYVNCNVTIFNGTEDEFTQEEIYAWERHTKHFFSTYNFPGEHFFINEKTEAVVKVINNILLYRNYQGHDYFTRRRESTARELSS